MKKKIEEKNNKKNYFVLLKKIKIEYGFLATLVLTIFLFGFLFAIRGFYPFSETPFMGVDFDSGYIPTYYKLWDILHFKSSFLFDWNLGLGLNVLGSMIANGFVSPICWLIGLFPRSFIPYAMSYIFLFKLLFMSGICYYSIGKILPETEQKYKTLFTLMYTFSSYILLMLTNILYLDSISLFPLLVYGLKELLENEKWKVFFFTLVAILVMSYYMAWMSLFFIIGASTIYLLVMKTDRKKEKLIKVILLSIFSLLFGAISFLPGFMLAKTSYRMSTNVLTNDGFDIYLCFQKLIHLISLGIPFALFTKQMFVKKDKRINIFFALLVFYLLIGTIVEPINALWHTGSHSGFVFREGFIPTFILILIGLYYLNNNKKYKDKFSFLSIVPEITFGIVYLIFVVSILKIYSVSYPIYADELSSTKYFYYPLILFIIVYFMILFSNKLNKKSFYIILVVMFALNTMPLMYILNEKLGDISSSIETQKVMDKINLDYDDNYNYKINFENYNINSPYILNISSMTNRLHFIKKSEIDFSDLFKFNYSTTIINSYGGNIFTDLLIQNKHLLYNKDSLPDSLYTLKESNDGIYYYDAKYNLNYLVPFNGSDLKLTSDDPYENSNIIYQTYFDKDDVLFEKVDVNLKDNIYSFKNDLSTEYVYYLYFTFDNDNLNSFKLKLDADCDYISDINDDYGNFFIYNLNEKIFKLETELNIYSFSVYRLDVNKYKDFVNEINTLDVKVNTKGTTRTYDVVSDKDQSVIIPVNYDDCFNIYVNGEQVDYKLALVNYISVDVKEGKNKIVIKYSNKWLKLGIIITIGSVLFLLLICFVNKKIDLLKFKIVKWPLFIIVSLFVIFFFLKVYILSWL